MIPYGSGQTRTEKICPDLNCELKGQLQPLSNFSKAKSRHDGYQHKCKKCMTRNRKDPKVKERQKELYLENKPKIDKMQAESYKRHREARLLSVKERYAEKSEEVKSKIMTYYESQAIYNRFGDRLSLYMVVKQNDSLLEVPCTYCGKYYSPRVVDAIRFLSYAEGKGKWENRFYCSDKCKEECPIFGQADYPKEFKPATSREVNPQFRQMVFQRDNYTCQKCETHQDNLCVGLHCHHIMPYINEPMFDCDLDNGLTVCKACHMQLHKLPGCGLGELRCNSK